VAALGRGNGGGGDRRVTRRRVSNPLALAALACLAERPMHPYEIASTLRERHKDDAIKLNYGSLYSVMEALCRNDLAVPKETVREGKRPERTVFELTPAGHHELFDWLSELLSEPSKEYRQYEAGLSLLPVLPPEEAIRLLTHRCEMIELELATERSVADYAKGKNIGRLFAIEREYKTMLRAAELKWTRELIAAIEDGSLEGLGEWRTWYPQVSEPPADISK
jgi:DNA-binding PadR family transcriptional regulator